MSRARVGLVALTAIAVLLAHPGTSIAGGTSESIREASAADPVLQRGAGYGSASQHAHVRTLQRTLRRLGWQPGHVDGLFGPRTEAAVERMQSAAGLVADGIVGPQTRRALRTLRAGRLRRGAGYAAPSGSGRVRQLQRELTRRGLRPGPVDGRFGPRTERAVARLQRAADLPADGAVDRPTSELLAQADSNPARNDRSSGERRPARRVSAAAVPQLGIDAPPDDVALAALLLGGALVLVVGALAGLLIARTAVVRPGIAVPLAGRVIAEGEAPSVGRFRGPVEALVLARRRFRRTPEAHYLVAAPARKSPFWVTHSEVETLVSPGRQSQPEERKPTRPKASPDGVRALGYASVPESAADEARSLREQATQVDSLCDEHGWRLLEVVHDVDSGNGKALERPGLQYALDRIARGEAACLVVPRLERLSRSVLDLARVIEAIRRGGGRLIVMDISLDTATSQGELAAETLVSIGEWEHRRLGERTRKGLAAAKARGATTGRAAVEDVPELKERIVAMRAEGMTLQAIADRLNAEGVPTIRGGKQWRPSSVQATAGYRRPRRAGGGDEQS